MQTVTTIGLDIANVNAGEIMHRLAGEKIHQ